ncbi:MAG: transglutaminase domain-containing protein [Clostridiales bacterium]|nr:transglutaminase domain-containing protein [Clostridiales bacterium]
MDIYKEHLIMEYKEEVIFSKSEQKIYNYLTSNVLYFTTNVNDIITKHVIHFISADDQVHIVAFKYPNNISEKFILQVFENIMQTFYIDGLSFDKSSEHYLEFQAARNYHLKVSSKAYSNMTVNDIFPLEGYFNSDEKIDSLTITVSRGDEQLEFSVPVENNSFMTNIYTPFGLGKHDIKIAITPKEEKITFDNSVPIDAPNEQLLLQYSVVNLSKYDIQYTIPTKMVQSNDRDIESMSKLLTRKFHTDYSKAKAIYDFILEDIEVLEINEINFSAREVYEQYQGTQKEIALYLTALLRAQDIPARIIEGSNAYVTHHWVEAYLNNEWIIVDPFGDSVLIELELDTMMVLPPGFNASKTTYKNRYPEKIILEH